MVTTAPGTSVHAPICKFVLRKRSARLLTITGVLVWLLTALATNHGAPSFQSWLAHFILPHTLLLSAAGWTTTVIPILVVRRYSLSTRWATEPTLGAYVLAALSKASTWRYLTVLALSGATAAFLHVFGVYSNDGWLSHDPKLAFFAPTKRYPYHLNERYVFLASCLAFAGATYAAKDVLLQRNVVRWAPKSHKTVGRAIQARLQDAAVEISVSAVLFPAIFWLSYLVIRAPIIRLLLSLPLTRPFIALFLRNSSAVYDLALYRHTSSLLFRVLIAWEGAQTLFDAYSSHPVKVAPLSSEPTKALVQGVKNSAEPYFEYMAWHELARITPDARKALFSQPPLWTSLVRDALLRLGKDYQHLAPRTAAPAPAQPGAPLPHPPTTPLSARVTQATYLKGSSVTKPEPPSPLRLLADDGAVTKALSAVPELFLSTGVAKRIGESVPSKDAVVKVAASTPAEPLVALPSVVRASWKGVKDFWAQKREDAGGAKALPDAEVDIVIVDALTRLVAASLEEDALGTVQRDIPRTLEALCTLLQAAEDSQAAGLGGGVPRLVDGLRAGIQLICGTFGDRMRAFRLPVRTARKLQGFMDYL
ncbi:hypothetical protein EXIGLDRAFT_332618 [Exidia glandulosa HHB12029]|uniref:Nucleoporin protein Ndc1-Nup n=1 Tax=Exidia glandulosa HHB12029 TaxID=1314781 RepID=A0A165LLE6_EXIGL|nr:hypothetical protein EXIGLDRAFT_332618 [Exidia glandulosa HHB12029]